MHEFFSKTDKKNEKLLFAGSLGLAVLFLVGSYLPGMPFPAVLQLIAFAFLTFVILVAARYLLVRYTYRVQEGEEGKEGELLVIEYCGRRIRTVCRVSLGAITDVQTVEASGRRAYAAAHKDRVIYNYTGEMRAMRALALEVDCGGERFCLYLNHNTDLERLLMLV